MHLFGLAAALLILVLDPSIGREVVESASASTQQAAAKLTPTDAATRDSSLRRLRETILAIARTGDVRKLQPLFAGEIVIDYDRSFSPAELVQELEKYSGEDRTLFWQDLREGVSLGFSLQGDAACAPYVVFELPPFIGDDPSIGIVAAGVNVRRAPDPSSPVIDKLSYVIVAQGPEEPRRATGGDFGGIYDWYQIRTPTGALGWVLAKYVRPAGSRRFCFRKERGQWKLFAWAAGD